jgi:hypothetical protein
LLATFPWSLSGGGAGELFNLLEVASSRKPIDFTYRIGVGGIMGSDDAFMRPSHVIKRAGDPGQWRPLVVGEQVRDYSVMSADPAFFPYDASHVLVDLARNSMEGQMLWPFRTELGNRATFAGRTYFAEGRPWFEWHQLPKDEGADHRCLTFAHVATHNHFVFDRGGKVFNRSAPVIKLPEGAMEREYLDLLGVLNSSTACFWLKQVSHRKGGGLQSGGGEADQPWSWIYEFTGTKLQEFPLPDSLPSDRAKHLDSLAQESTSSLRADVLSRGINQIEISANRERWQALRAQMIFAQEELDWQVYHLYGLTDEDLTYSGTGVDMLSLGERAFEIALARKIEGGSEESAWFERHGSTPTVELPSSWSSDYADLMQRRLNLISSDPFIGLLERPEYKRRWQSASFDDLLPQAIREFILDRLEEPSLWSDTAGPQVLSVAQLADRVRGDEHLVEAVRLLLGAVDVDLTRELGMLISDEAVPFLAANRYKDSGMRKRDEWEQVWELQRREDAGEKVSIPVPPKYGPTDFRKTAYWQARGKLDVPKERFITYPGAERAGDGSMIIGWAGWDQLEQARALARLLAERMAADDISPGARLPLLAGLVELEPWLHQWHVEASPEFGGSPAVFMTGFIESQLAAIGKTREDCKAWRP